MIKDTDFALHGGTAINFFVRDMPRLSVDIDLTYLRLSSHEETIKAINEQLKSISKRISSSMPSMQIEEKAEVPNSFITKLFVKRHNAIVKIEPNQIIRGSLFGCEERDLCKKAEEIFEKFVITKTLSFSELYGSKICAALDRQHPRDIFDIMLLLKNEGITNQVRKAFLVYLISHNRPISELLSPNFKDMKPIFEKEFTGMTSVEVKYEELLSVRKILVEEINKRLTDDERAFLVSFKKREPKWDLLNIKGAQDMPAVKWKLANLAKMNDEKHKQAVRQLKKVIAD
ncbi:MAG: nucleotidyl transferase AbiEii/AbiGii toxin family protein [Candidatus Omnitrophica bacterium]|nr:nucleotidyl transferase AbiEii/AbiGii toxin family protein [Candidatus Omnitrophota bacterium]MBU2504896.1 nucleotidyl transferase AbiEii/AbiGii toxin family protein [Candidatus Omnitrophota bacterium]